MSKSQSRKNSVQGTLINFANMDDTYNIKTSLYEDHNVDILVLQNQKLYTLLHLSCYNNNEELTNLYMNYLQAQIDRNVFTKEQIRDWINLQNDEGFTALHLAAYRGSLKSVELLESYGADNKIRNYNELTVLHTAAQGDSPVTCYYYIKKGFDINAMDNKGSTPLHWAAYSGAFNSVNFLLTWGSNINQQDLDTGVTALHLAVMQGNTRIVRKLLMKGIDRNIRESSGKTAQDLATEQDFKTIAIMIRDKIGILEYCNVRQPFRPVVKRSRSLFAFMSMYLTCFILTIVFTFPYVVNTAWLIAFFVLTIQTVVYFLISWLLDPGIVKPDKHVDMLQMLSKYDCSTICAECQLVRPKRSKHCDVCQKCVMVYDHHCPWINNCVGARNLFVFYLFVLSLFLELMLQILMQAQHVTQQDTVRFFESNNWLITGKYVTFGYVLLYCISFSIPIGILLYFQTVNIFVGQTTFERHSMGAQQTTTQNDEESSIESLQPKKPQVAQPSLSNCFEMCFENRANSEYTRDMSANMIEL